MAKVAFCKNCDMYLNDDGYDMQEIIVGITPILGKPVYADEVCCNACSTPVTYREELYPTLLMLVQEHKNRPRVRLG